MTERWTSSNTGRRAQAARRVSESAALRELVQEVGELRRANAQRESREWRSSQAPPRYPQAQLRSPQAPPRSPRSTPRSPQPQPRFLEPPLRQPRTGAGGRRDTRPRYLRPPRARRRRRLLLLAGAAALVLLLLSGAFGGPRSFARPSAASLAGLSLNQRIVAVARSQIGYRTNPSSSYCNKFSAYWQVGSPNCPGAETSEEWCADFAAWAWRQAGVDFIYGFGTDELNASAASFYEWGVAHGTWHSASSGYRAMPGDVAVYGLSLGSSASAAHVAIVTGDPQGQDGPDVINGDGDRTGFSVVETGTDQLRADAGHGQGAPLAGYVSP